MSAATCRAPLPSPPSSPGVMADVQLRAMTAKEMTAQFVPVSSAYRLPTDDSIGGLTSSVDFGSSSEEDACPSPLPSATDRTSDQPEDEPSTEEPEKVPLPGVLHEATGMQIMPLGLVDRDRAVDMYMRLQKSAPLFLRLGITGENLRGYAEHIVDGGRSEPWNAAAVDADGRVQAMAIFVRDVGSLDTSRLCPAAKAHWALFTELELACRRRSGWATSGHICATFVGMMPEFQGKGLYADLSEWQANRAAEHGILRYWSWTVNPNMMRATMKGAGNLNLGEAAKALFKAPPALTNTVLAPTLRALGFAPYDSLGFWVAIDSLPIPRLVAVAEGVNPLVSSLPLPTSGNRAALAVRRRQSRRARRRNVTAAAALLVALILAAMPRAAGALHRMLV